ncbi:hypothetical protein D3C77_391580 [compost metagenome]
MITRRLPRVSAITCPPASAPALPSDGSMTLAMSAATPCSNTTTSWLFFVPLSSCRTICEIRRTLLAVSEITRALADTDGPT